MKIKHYLFLLISFWIGLQANSQIAANYEVGTWKDFKTAAVTYTFDDNCPNQIPVAIPLFNNYGFKTTFFAVTTSAAGAAPNWNSYKTVSSNGHEIASHTVNHKSLNTISVSEQDTELKNSQSTINTQITTQKCVTVAYPNCNTGDVNTIQKYYIAGRTCSGQIISKSPSDFYNLSSIICGNTGVNTAADMTAKVTSAKNSGGWCVFLIHGIGANDGYSPLESSVLSAHLTTMNTNKADYWVGTFGNVVKYIKERNALKLVETTISSDSLHVTPTDNLDNAIYDAAVTIRRALPASWTAARVRDVSGKIITSSIVTVNSKKYVMFDATPDKGVISIANPNRITTGFDNQTEQNELALKVYPNPFNSELTVNVSGQFDYLIQTMTGETLYSGVSESKIEVGNELAKGVYLLNISQLGVSKVIKIVKN